ncbi:MAG: ABC transporter permease [Clostridiales bacterium]|nr:ABC transporter permease [Clostridiales bacterium]
MSLSSIRYLLREGFRNLWQNRFMAVASIAVLMSCLLLTGGAYLIFVNINYAFDLVYEQNVVVAFAREELSEEETVALGDKLRSITNVAEVKFVSKEESLQKYSDSIPEATFESLQGENNPLLDTFVVSFEDLSRFDATLAQIEQIPEVDSTRYNGDIAALLTKVRHVVMVVGGWIVGMLLLVSLFIIANTIKLTVYNRRLEIYIMKSVGATDGFIRVPFIIEGMVLGLIAGVLSYAIIYYVYGKLTEMFRFDTMMGLVSFSRIWMVVLIGFLCAGVFVGVFGSAISMGKYLKEEGSAADEK